MHWYNYLITILLSGFIGYGIIWFAIKMLFRPRRPKNIFGYKYQGIFPKNQIKIAEMLGHLSTELLPFADIEQRITSADNLEKLKPEIEAHIDVFLNKKFREVFPILSKFIGEKTTNQIKTAFMEELESMFPTLMHKYMSQLKQDIDLEKIVIEKVSGFSVIKLEYILKQITKKEFQFLKITGAAFGCLIGAIQVLINILAH
ncbi:MAG: DUF445 family protein [Bacteroidota bacterium]|nr:DUF445 family protein [Bacteroidota bacterium]